MPSVVDCSSIPPYLGSPTSVSMRLRPWNAAKTEGKRKGSRHRRRRRQLNHFRGLRLWGSKNGTWVADLRVLLRQWSLGCQHRGFVTVRMLYLVTALPRLQRPPASTPQRKTRTSRRTRQRRENRTHQDHLSAGWRIKINARIYAVDRG